MWKALFVLVCVFVGCHCNMMGPQSGAASAWFDPKIYTFAFPAIAPGSRFNGTHLFGPRVDLMYEVCCRARKRCQPALVEFIRCWNNFNQSEVLNGRWYDVCMQLSTISRRTVSYSFSDINFLKVPNPAIVVRKKSNVTLDDLRNPRNKLKLVFMAVPELGTAGVLEVYRERFFIEPENVIRLERGAGNDVTSEILRLINDPCSGVQLGIIVTALARKDDPFKILAELPVDLGYSTIMVRMDDQHIIEWWDFYLKKLMCSKDYKPFCRELDRKFGADPTNCPDLNQINCAEDCEPDVRVPVCQEDCRPPVGGAVPTTTKRPRNKKNKTTQPVEQTTPTPSNGGGEKPITTDSYDKTEESTSSTMTPETTLPVTTPEVTQPEKPSSG